MNTPDTPTPRTDGAVWSPYEETIVVVVDADFARQLERELTAAKEELAATKYVAGNLGQEVARKLNEANAELALLRKRVEAADGLATVLEEFADVGLEYYDMDMGPNGSRMLDASRMALAAYRATEGKK